MSFLSQGVPLGKSIVFLRADSICKHGQSQSNEGEKRKELLNVIDLVRITYVSM